MKALKIIGAKLVCIVVVYLSNGHLRAQGTFLNLNFEAAVLVPVPDGLSGQVFFAPAYPGWLAYYDASPVSTVSHNNPTLGSSNLGILDTNFGPSLIGEGMFSALLQGGSPIVAPDVSLAQTGFVPSDSKSLRFLAASSGGAFAATLGGLNLDLLVLQDFGTYKEYAADISTFAGQSAELRFTQFHGPLRGNLGLDAISFSTVSIPEPSTWILLGLGSALLWCGAWRRRK